MKKRGGSRSPRFFASPKSVLAIVLPLTEVGDDSVNIVAV
jgi:hypothetical protein